MHLGTRDAAPRSLHAAAVPHPYPADMSQQLQQQEATTAASRIAPLGQGPQRQDKQLAAPEGPTLPEALQGLGLHPGGVTVVLTIHDAGGLLRGDHVGTS